MGVAEPGHIAALGLGSAILDISVVMAFIQGERQFDLSGYEQLMLSSVTYAELRMGVACASRAEP